MLDLAIRFDRGGSLGRRPARTALLTGATGFLGANLLGDLLAHTALDIWCLVRAAAPNEAIARLKCALAAQGLPSKGFEGRVRPILGDLGEPYFGLGPSEWDALGRGVDVIYHNAAQINFLLPYRALRRVNVSGMETILRLAAVTGRPILHFVSSTKVFGASKYATFLSPASAVCHEKLKVAVPPRGSGYTQTKWVAERLVLTAAERGLSASIYRLGMLTPHSGTGDLGGDGVFSLMLLACGRLGVAPELNADLHLTPVDVASRAIVKLSDRTGVAGRAWHLMNPVPIAWSEVAGAMREAGLVGRLVPYEKWRRLLIHHARDRGGDMEILSVLLSSGRPPFASAKRMLGQKETLAALAECKGVSYPCDNLALLSNYLARVRLSGAAEDPASALSALAWLPSTPERRKRADAS